MPVYNGSCFVGEAIESILAQTYRNFELIIVNDLSTDETPIIIERYRQLYPKKIKVIHLRKRHGAYGAANVAMRYAKGEFIAPMDADDVSHPRRIQKQVEFFLENNEAIVVGTQARIIDKEGKIIGEKTFPTGHREIYQKFLEVHPIVHPSCMIRRSLLPKKNRLYEDKYGVNDDYYTFFTFFRYGKFFNLPDYFLDYRIHFGNSSLQNLKQKFYNTVKIRLVAMIKLKYRPTLSGLVKLLGQILLVTILPGPLLTDVYLMIKGIDTSGKTKVSLLQRLGLTFVKMKNFSFALFSHH